MQQANNQPERIMLHRNRADVGDVDTGNRAANAQRNPKQYQAEMAQPPVRNQKASDAVFYFYNTDNFERKANDVYALKDTGKGNSHEHDVPPAEKPLERASLRDLKKKHMQNACLDEEKEKNCPPKKHYDE